MTTINLEKSRVSTTFSSLFKKDVLGAEILKGYEKSEEKKGSFGGKWTESLMAEQEVLNYLQQKGWEIDNMSEVESFLKEHPPLIGILKEAPDIVEKYFKEANPVLKLFRSREEDYKELFLNIFTDLEVDPALERLEKIDQNWLIPVVNKETVYFNLDVKFKK